MSDRDRAQGERHALLTFAAALALVGLCGQLLTGEPVLLYLAPALLLAALHGCDAGPGKRLLALLGAIDLGGHAPPGPPPVARRLPGIAIARGGALVGAAIAGRGPPRRRRLGPPPLRLQPSF
jgi:hypothetical protein